MNIGDAARQKFVFRSIGGVATEKGIYLPRCREGRPQVDKAGGYLTIDNESIKDVS